MDETFERLRALDGKRVWAALVRAKDAAGPAIYRSGTFRLFAPSGGSPATCIADADDLPVVHFLGVDLLTIVDGALRAVFRPSFYVDVRERPFAEMPDADAERTYDHAARELVAELEAGFRAALIVRPDPDPDASVRAQHGMPPVEDAPLSDWSVRFAVGHNSATMRPHDLGIVRLSCTASIISGGIQRAEAFVPVAGALYDLTAGGVERLASDIRRFMSGRLEFFERSGLGDGLRQ